MNSLLISSFVYLKNNTHACKRFNFVIYIVLQTKGINWKVPTGRFDGRVSLASETSNLPGFRDSVDVQKSKFKTLGLNTQDLVTLVGK